MKHIHIKLLEEMEVSGLNELHDVSPFLKNNFEKPQAGPHGWPTALADKFMREMQELGYIGYNQYDFYKVCHAANILSDIPENTVEKWFEDPLMVRLTPKGIDFLYQQKLIQSNFASNEASIQALAIAQENAKAQESASNKIFIISLLTAFLGVLTLAGTIYQANLSKSIEREQQRLSGQVSTLQIKQNQLSSRMDSIHIQPPFSEGSLRKTK